MQTNRGSIAISFYDNSQWHNMLQLHNQTSYETALGVFCDPKGVDTAYIVIKATFRLEDPLQSADEVLPIFYSDDYWGDPAKTSIRYPADMTLKKSGTDVILVGSAYAPHGEPVTEMEVSLRIGPKAKMVRVFGDRVWDRFLWRPFPSRSKPFEVMPLVYERAFGGKDSTEDGQEDWVLSNPVGKGFRMEKSKVDLRGLPLPNIEEPSLLIRKWRDRPMPAAFGAIAPHWEPRCSFAGTYDGAWQKQRAPFLPLDFNVRYLNAAHPDLICDVFLQGGESVKIQGVRPDRPYEFVLPAKRFRIRYHLAGKEADAPNDLETVLFDTDEGRFAMVWRAAIPCEKQVLKLRWVVVEELPTSNRRETR
jgi:hypothetical protein